MESKKFESLLNFILGVSWATLLFGSAFIFAITLKSSSFVIALILTFLFFSVFSLIIIFLESKKSQIKELKEIKKQREIIEAIAKKLELEIK